MRMPSEEAVLNGLQQFLKQYLLGAQKPFFFGGGGGEEARYWLLARSFTLNFVNTV